MAGVIRLYDDLVSLGEDLKAKRRPWRWRDAQKNNRLEVEQGTLAPVELTRAQAEVAAAQQDLANSRGNLRQQELVVKSVLTRRGTADAIVHDAHLQPTTPIEIPAQEPVQMPDELVAEAFPAGGRNWRKRDCKLKTRTSRWRDRATSCFRTST